MYSATGATARSHSAQPRSRRASPPVSEPIRLVGAQDVLLDMRHAAFLGWPGEETRELGRAEALCLWKRQQPRLAERGGRGVAVDLHDRTRPAVQPGAAAVAPAAIVAEALHVGRRSRGFDLVFAPGAAGVLQGEGSAHHVLGPRGVAQRVAHGPQRDGGAVRKVQPALEVKRRAVLVFMRVEKTGVALGPERNPQAEAPPIDLCL